MDAVPSKYSWRWSQGLLAGALVALGIWGPIYNVLNDTFAEKWWFTFASAFVVIAALVTVSWLTCSISEFLDRRDRGQVAMAKH